MGPKTGHCVEWVDAHHEGPELKGGKPKVSDIMYNWPQTARLEIYVQGCKSVSMKTYEIILFF